MQLYAPSIIVPGQPIIASFEAEQRVSGRLRLTLDTEAIEFTLEREGRDPVRSNGPRLRGKQASFAISDWGEHRSGTELVLRFEGAKVWLTVA